MLITTIIGYAVSLFFYLSFVLITQITGQPQDSIAMIYFFIFVALFDAPHIYQTWVRTHLDTLEYKRRPFFHWGALIIPIALAVFALAEGYGETFNLLLGLYGGWHITRQSIGFQRFLSRKRNVHNERFIYSVYFYFLFNNAASSKELWDTFLNPSVLEFFQYTTKAALIIIAFNFLLKIRKNFHRDDKFTLITCIYFLGLTHANIHPLLITAMATIAHNIQYQVWMWDYIKNFFSKTQASLSFAICMLIGAITAIIPEQGVWIYISQVYLGLVLWHYFIDGYIWRFRECPELKILLPKN